MYKCYCTDGAMSENRLKCLWIYVKLCKNFNENEVNEMYNDPSNINTSGVGG